MKANRKINGALLYDTHHNHSTESIGSVTFLIHTVAWARCPSQHSIEGVRFTLTQKHKRAKAMMTGGASACLQ
jgi:hypothetical protein